MILHHIFRENTGVDDGDYDFITASKAAWLLADHFIMETSASIHIIDYNKYFFKFTEEEYIRFQKRIAPKDSKEYRGYSDAIKYKELARKTRLTHTVHKQMVELLKIVREARENHRAKNESVLRKYKCWELLECYNAEMIEMVVCKLFNENEKNEDYYVEYLRKIFYEKQNILVITKNPAVFSDTVEWMPRKNDQSLVSYAFLSGMSADSVAGDMRSFFPKILRYTRENMLKNIKDFNLQLQNLSIQCSKMNYEPSAWQALQNLVRENVKGANLLQQIADKELYLQQIRNSGTTKVIHVNVGICPMEDIVNYYEKIGMMQSYQTDILKERIDKTGGFKLCCLYYNIWLEAIG